MGSLWDRFEADKQIKDFYLQHRTEESVDCITFAELLGRHNLSKIDLLQVDVEGYELEILRTIDFGQYFIRFVNYEHALLHEHKKEAQGLMRESGYRLLHHDIDTFCYRANDRQKLLWSWIEGLRNEFKNLSVYRGNVLSVVSILFHEFDKRILGYRPSCGLAR